MTPPRSQLTFSYWSDPMCIWAYVAQAKLEQLLRSADGQLLVEYRVVPVFGSIPWRVTSGPWAKAGLSGRVEATHRIAREHDCPEVSGECWARDAPASSWAAGAAIKAVGAAEQAGELPPGTGGEYLKQLRARFFVDNENIARRRVQLSVAEALAIPRAPLEARLDDGSALSLLWEDEQEKDRLRIQGSPTYVFDGGRAMLYGNFHYGVLQATVEQLLAGARASGSNC